MKDEELRIDSNATRLLVTVRDILELSKEGLKMEFTEEELGILRNLFSLEKQT